MTKFIVESENEKVYKKQLQAFKQDTGFIGIFKQNLHYVSVVYGEEILGITDKGQLVKITFDGIEKKLTIEW